MLHYDGKQNITIKGKKTDGIRLENCVNVKISGSIISGGESIYLHKCTNVTIEGNLIKNVKAGVVASLCTGVYINSNQFLNMQGPPKSGQFVQFIECYGKGNKITKNRMENIYGNSNPEDAINIYKSNGDPDSWIEISYNWIRGGGPSATGGGIVLGDDNGSYQKAFDNILVNPGQYGMAVVGGHHMQIKNNYIYSKKQPFTNVGLIAWDYYLTNMHDIDISGNYVNFINSLGAQNAMWDAMSIGLVKNNFVDTTLSERLLPKTLITKLK